MTGEERSWSGRDVTRVTSMPPNAGASVSMDIDSLSIRLSRGFVWATQMPARVSQQGTTVNRQRNACDHRRFVRGKEKVCKGNIFRAHESPQGGSPNSLVVVLFVFY